MNDFENFKDFYDTACAIKNMDLVISTDNVILNLAGALGVKTIGLFNKYTNYRWYKLKGNDTGWYKSVRPIRAKVQDDWEQVFEDLLNVLR
jgi:ADP-heptose:LPS heptosyltransferase